MDIKKKPVLAQCPDYSPEHAAAAMEQVIENTIGLNWVKPGMRIGLKLNLCTARKPEAAATTHPVLVSTLARMLVERGADVVIGDSPGEPFTQTVLNFVYAQTGIKECEQTGAKLNMDFRHGEVSFPEGVSVKRFEYCTWLSECDAIINFSKLKAHGLMGMTAAVKNLYGVIPGTVKSEYHFMHRDPADFANLLVDLNEYVRPVLCICDAVEIMEGNGPTQGTARHLGLLLAGASSYELDRLCAQILDVRESEIPYLMAAQNRGLLAEEADPAYARMAAPYRLKDFERSGATGSWFLPDPRDKLGKKILKKALYLVMRSRPEADKSCIACGHCVKGCPANAIEIRKGIAVIDRKKCVRCFCCQEFCPAGAMKVKRSLVAKIASK